MAASWEDRASISLEGETRNALLTSVFQLNERRGGKVFVACEDGWLYAYSSSNGYYNWRSSVNLTSGSIQMFGTPAVSDDKVFIGSPQYNKTYAFSKDTGAKVWEYSTAGPVWYGEALAYGNVYLGTYSGNKVYALRQADGTKVWDYTIGGNVVVAPAVADGVVFISATDKTMYALNATTGAKLWNYTIADTINTPAVIADGLLYYGTSGKMLSAIGTLYTPPQPTVSTGFPMEYVIGIVVAVAAVAVVLLLLMRRKPAGPPPPKPPKAAGLRVTSDQKEVFADGKSAVDLTIDLLDDKENPIASDTNREIMLSVTDGKIAGAVTLMKGTSSVKASMVSTTKVGAVTISAASKDLVGAQTTVAFTEKKRYCMICGQRMPIDARVCPNCGSVPPSGADTKACKNCGAVIPIVAKFCKECGASQPT